MIAVAGGVVALGADAFISTPSVPGRSVVVEPALGVILRALEVTGPAIGWVLWSCGRQGRTRATVPWLTLVLGCLSALTCLGVLLPRWDVVAGPRATVHGEFAMCRRSVALQTEFVLGVVRVRRAWKTEVEKPASARMESDYPILIRPDGHPPGDGIALGSDGMVFGLLGNVCIAALRRGSDDATHAVDVRSLSPFALLSGVGSGNVDDLARVQELVRAISVRDDAFAFTHPGAMRDGVGELSAGVPLESSLLRDMESPNPWVRDAARGLLLIGGARAYPEGAARLKSR